jgi:hypothetical protein
VKKAIKYKKKDKGWRLEHLKGKDISPTVLKKKHVSQKFTMIKDSYLRQEFLKYRFKQLLYNFVLSLIL